MSAQLRLVCSLGVCKEHVFLSRRHISPPLTTSSPPRAERQLLVLSLLPRIITIVIVNRKHGSQS